jgi:molybdopterin-containing oxidoreductase family iron-sulfur binding subunit
MGFGVAAATLASCEAPIRNAIPYVNKPEDLDPGVPNYYASSYWYGGQFASVVVKTREGRPIKVEGNTLSKISEGGTSAQVDASILSLYDKERLNSPKKGDDEISWTDLDKAAADGFSAASAAGKKIVLVSNTIISPTYLRAIEEFKFKYPTAELVQYDSQTAYGMLKSNEEVFGIKAIPTYMFDKADVIVSFEADFLGTWIDPIEFTKRYSRTRKLDPKKKKMSRHYQFEANLSLTGANADYRTPIKPSEQGPAVLALYNAIASAAGNATVSGGTDFNNIKKAASDLLKAKGKALVVSGSNDPAVQNVVAAINNLLESYGNTINFSRYSKLKQGDESAFDQFVDDAASGNVGAAIILNCNPVYNHPQGAKLAEALSKVDFTISTADRKDETASSVSYIAPTNHFLESWGDTEPKNGVYNLIQPTINKLFNTRQQEASILTWSGNNTDYFDFLKNNWRQNFGEGKTGLTYQSFWDKCLQDGVYAIKVEDPELDTNINVDAAASAISASYKGSGVELSLYYKVAIGDGTQGNNPWLHETPDPITKATWDNYLTVSISDAKEWGINETEGKANKVNLSVNGSLLNLPVIIQPGQAKGTVGLALGFGRTSSGRVGNNLGVDATSLITKFNGTQSYNVSSGVSIEVTSEMYQVAKTQTHQTYMDRGNVVQESTLAAYKKDSYAGREIPHVATWQSPDGKVRPGEISLWKGHKYKDHHWGLAIDMNACTGCSACHVACVSENNIPVVGRQEVINRRDMHWMRIDRYYSSDESAVASATGVVDGYRALEKAAENPEVTFQPMMCQHCNNAGCETVCPVAATTHSTEGLNQMVYNRCIGTRYCANNCAYKVRRFNWFKYHDNTQFDKNLSMNNALGKMVLNPDVTVRSRGVMEKCTMCVQRIQLGKLTAKKEGRRMTDDDVSVACASSCPAEAILFGDMNDPKSSISKQLKIKDKEDNYDIDKQIGEERAYTVLEEIGAKPNVLYLTKIRNKDKEETHA